MPNEKTVVCPLDVQDLAQTGQNTLGFDTVWIVENTSLEPVVLSFIGANGIEYSASNPTITPPQNDPQAHLEPKAWRAINAWDGHVFHARTFDPETGNLGPVVLQHRMGLIPVGAHAQELVCPEDDPEPLVTPKEPSTEPQRDPNFKRTTPTINRPCNTMDIGFRNMANCPLHGYYIARREESSCQEQFKFHLGKNLQPRDFMWQWDSRTKFEQSYVGHSFAFRLAANPSILVDTVTFQPTRIIDCPRLKEKAQGNKVTSVGEPQGLIFPFSNDGEASKHGRLLDNLHLGQHVMAAVFNMTFNVTSTTNGTDTNGRRRRSSSLQESARSSYYVVDSF